MAPQSPPGFWCLWKIRRITDGHSRIIVLQLLKRTILFERNQTNSEWFRSHICTDNVTRPKCLYDLVLLWILHTRFSVACTRTFHLEQSTWETSFLFTYFPSAKKMWTIYMKTCCFFAWACRRWASVLRAAKWWKLNNNSTTQKI